MNKTTTNDFLFFKQECEFWMKVLGLHSWKVYYKHERCEEDVLGDASTHYTGQVATIRLSKVWGIAITADDLRETALHEVMEVLMSPLWSHAGSRFWDSCSYERDHHRIIRTITELLLKGGREKNYAEISNGQSSSVRTRKDYQREAD